MGVSLNERHGDFINMLQWAKLSAAYIFLQTGRPSAGALADGSARLLAGRKK